MKKFYVTTPIYYVNDVPHIGHAYTTIAADVLARYYRMRGRDVFFLTGTDEHGQKVEKAAREKGLAPKEHADEMVVNFKKLWQRLNISNDAFMRTTDEQHKKTVQGILQTLYQKGEIEKRIYKGWYCTPDERFWTEKETIDGNCPECGRPVEYISEENYFFLMGKYQKKLIEYIEDNPQYILPETRKNEVLGFLRNQQLGDLCISRPRSRLSWGIPLPFDEEYVTYVWFDALVNYYSATKYLAPKNSSELKVTSLEKKQILQPPNSELKTQNSKLKTGWWPPDHHLVGKDILTTHSIYWSIMLLALDLPLPRNIFAHGWWMIEGEKMSKSLGNVVDPNKIINKFGVDSLRYFLLREVPFGLDGDFSENSLIKRINTDLANDLGNLLSRSLTMIERYRAGIVPQAGADREGEKRIQALFNTLLDSFDGFFERLEFHHALNQLWIIISELNQYIDRTAPYKERDQGILSNILYTLAESLRLIALYLFPFMPSTAENTWKQLGIKDDINKVYFEKVKDWGGLTPGTKIMKGGHLFPRIVERKPGRVRYGEKIQS